MMRSMFSPQWFRVADFRPRLKTQARFFKHRYRGKTWFIVQNALNGQHHRISVAAYQAARRMNGEYSLAQIWEQLGAELGNEQPSQDDLIQLVSQFYMGDLLLGDVTPDLEEISDRSRRQSRQERIGRFKNPLAIRVPLIDPNRFLDRTIKFIAPLFSQLGLIAWLMLIISGSVVALLNFDAMSDNFFDRVLAVNNILILVLLYPVIKAFHELGHAFTVKYFGGEVHEIGIMFLVLFPVPYVDASAASVFADKRARMLVGAAGIMVELAIASVAMILWSFAEPGFARAVLFNAMLIGGVSTLLFNGNPLLRFDGYYVLADWLEAPNLGKRANQYLVYLCQRHFLGLDRAENPEPPDSKDERTLVIYGLLALIYRLFIVFGIALFVSTKLFFIGVLLALFGLSNMFILPLGRFWKFLRRSPTLSRQRTKAYQRLALLSGAMIAMIFVAPTPHNLIVEGVVFLDEDAHVRAKETGFVEANALGGAASSGQTILQLHDPILDAELAFQESRARELDVMQGLARLQSAVRVGVLAEQAERARGAYAYAEARLNNLTVAPQTSGQFVRALREDLTGRLIEQGRTIGYVLDPERVHIRVLAPQNDVGLIDERLRSAEGRMAHDIDRVLALELVGKTPAALDQGAYGALTPAGGGTAAVDPTDPDGRRFLQTLFEYRFRPQNDLETFAVGERIYVRLFLGWEPIGARAYRRVRQLFLSLYGA